MSDDIIVKDSNGNILGNGDSVTLIKDLKVKGTSVTLKRGTLVDPAATDTAIWDPLNPDARDDLPSRAVMLPAAAVADAVHYAITRPPEVGIPAVSIERS